MVISRKEGFLDPPIAHLVSLGGWLASLKNSSWFTRRRNKARADALRHFIQENMPEHLDDVDHIIKKSQHSFEKFHFWNFTIIFSVILNRINIVRRLTMGADVQGLEILDKYREEGVIGLSYHIGPITLVPVLMSLLGYDTTFLVRPDTIEADSTLSIEKINGYLERFCSPEDIGLIRVLDSFKPTSIIQMKKRLRKHELLFVYPDTDRDGSAQCTPIPFFNTELVGHLGLAKLYRMTHARFVPIDVGWHPDGQLFFHVGEPLDIREEQTDKEIVRTVYSRMEGQVRARLPQWVQVGSYEALKF